MNRFHTILAIGLNLLIGCGRESTIVESPRSSPESKPTLEARPEPIAEEPDEATLLARISVQNNCLICHSIELIETQRLSARQWKAEVEKMAGWGSPIPAEDQEGVIKYLASNYPETLARPSKIHWTIDEALDMIAPRPLSEPGQGPVDLAKGEASFATNCKNCHGVNGEGSNLGPSLVERPVLTRPADFIETVGKGRGRMPMLGPIVDKPSTLAILGWLKSKRYPAPPVPAR